MAPNIVAGLYNGSYGCHILRHPQTIAGKEEGALNLLLLKSLENALRSNKIGICSKEKIDALLRRINSAYYAIIILLSLKRSLIGLSVEQAFALLCSKIVGEPCCAIHSGLVGGIVSHIVVIHSYSIVKACISILFCERVACSLYKDASINRSIYQTAIG